MNLALNHGRKDFIHKHTGKNLNRRAWDCGDVDGCSRWKKRAVIVNARRQLGRGFDGEIVHQ